ncbi:FHA domain-containing protein (plasmid) [Mycolicibacterium aichiense]|uniref:FHA domain-containing protein n=1 Tax=Mycolicibacterium aichiense TaxID=1799 RepID=UPI003D669835
MPASDTDPTGSVGSSTDNPLKPLVLRCGQHRHRLDPDAGEVTVGRAPTCTVHLDFKWLSRIHVRLTPDAGGWLASDSSRNGIFVAGQRVTTVAVSAGTVINLGDPEGMALSFQDPSDSGPLAPEDDEEDFREVTDPGMVRAGRAVAERRKALGITQRDMAASGVLNAGALVSFEKARSWPHERTLAKLENALQWPAGTITAIRRGEASPDDETTQVVATTVATPLITQSIQLAVNGIDAAISALPSADSPTSRLAPRRF